MKKHLLTNSKNERGITKLNSNAFTLIELLAIIVILAIIAVITIPILLNVIENSRKGAATDSAYGFKDSINKYYITKLADNRQFQLEGEYTIIDGKLKGDNIEENGVEIPISGTIPSSGSLIYSNNTLIEGCLVIDEYEIIFDGSKISATVKGDCSTFVSKYTKRVAQVGDEICFGLTNECFYVLKKFTDGELEKVMLFSKYGLKKDTINNIYKQDANSPDYVSFGASSLDVNAYWFDPYSNNFKSSYAKDIDGNAASFSGDPYPYLYNSYSDTYAYVEGYLNTLKNEYSLSENISGRLLTYEEVKDEIIFDNGFDFTNGQFYWLGSGQSLWKIWSVYRSVGNNGNFTYGEEYGGFSNHPCVRPVIFVSITDLEKGTIILKQ